MLPLLLDGFAQKLTSYQSGNLRRLVTGILFGYALVGLVSITTILQRRQDLSLEKSKIKRPIRDVFILYRYFKETESK